MKNLRTWTAAVTACALLAATASAEILEFNIAVDGGQEVPATASTAVGAAQLLYDTDTQQFDFDLMVFGIDLADLLDVGANSTPVHIHYGAAGVNGGIAVDLGYLASFVDDGLGIRLEVQDALFGGVQGSLTTDLSTNEAALFAGELYVNIHTTDYPAGEIRGQIVPEPASLALLLLGGIAVLRRR